MSVGGGTDGPFSGYVDISKYGAVASVLNTDQTLIMGADGLTRRAAISALPVSSVPSGPAGGDLGSNYPNPQVVATHLAAALPMAQGGLGVNTLTAHGVLIGNGSGAIAFAGPSANNGFAMRSGGNAADPSFTSALAARVQLTSNLLVPNVTGTPVQWDNAAIFDTGGFYSNAQRTRITFPRAGIYSVGACIQWDNQTANARFIDWRINGTTFYPAGGVGGAGLAASERQIISVIDSFNAADYVEVIAFSNQGGNVNITGGMIWVALL